MTTGWLGILLGISGLALGVPSESTPRGAWPQWRGPHRNGKIDGAPWPDKIDAAHLRPMWRREIGHGYSGPIVSEERVFTVETLDKRQEIVRAFDRTSAEQLWETSWDGAMKVPFFAARNGSWVRSTPAYDGEYLYVAGMRDVLVCLEAANGAVKWQIDFAEHFGTPLPSFGFVCSPLVADGAVYVQAGGGVVKLDKDTGDVLWHSLRDGGGMNGGAFSSPILAAPGGVSQLVVQMRNVLAGIEPQGGKVLWQQQVTAFRGMNILTPVVLGDTIFTSSYGGASRLYEMKPSSDGLALTEVWRDRSSQGYMSTPVVIDGYIYLHRRDRRFSCLGPQARKVLWTANGRFGQYWSLVANGSQILALDQKGELLLINANPTEFSLADRRKIAEQETWAHLAVAGDQVFVRELQAIAVYRWCVPLTAELH